MFSSGREVECGGLSGRHCILYALIRAKRLWMVLHPPGFVGDTVNRGYASAAFQREMEVLRVQALRRISTGIHNGLEPA